MSTHHRRSSEEQHSSPNVVWNQSTIQQPQRAQQKQQKPVALWFTGLSGSGKSTLSNALEHRLYTLGRHTYRLDGDNVRHGVNRDLGFSSEDRVENIRRVGEIAKLFVDAGLIVITAFISPFRQDRDMVRARFAEGEFLEVFVDTALEVCEQRDPKNLYARARRGEIPDFTGISSPYEAPVSPEIHIKTPDESVEAAVDRMVEILRERGVFTTES